MGKYQFTPGSLEEVAKKLYGSDYKSKLYDEQGQENLNAAFISDNATRLKNAGVNTVARLDSVEEIIRILPKFVAECRSGSNQLPHAHVVEQASRRHRSSALVALLNESIKSPDY